MKPPKMQLGDTVEAEVEWRDGKTRVMRGKLIALTADEVFLETEIGAVSGKRETAEVIEP